MIIKKNLSLVAMVPGKDDIVGLLIIDEKVQSKMKLFVFILSFKCWIMIIITNFYFNGTCREKDQMNLTKKKIWLHKGILKLLSNLINFLLIFALNLDHKIYLTVWTRSVYLTFSCSVQGKDMLHLWNRIISQSFELT